MEQQFQVLSVRSRCVGLAPAGRCRGVCIDAVMRLGVAVPTCAAPLCAQPPLRLPTAAAEGIASSYLRGQTKRGGGR